MTDLEKELENARQYLYARQRNLGFKIGEMEREAKMLSKQIKAIEQAIELISKQEQEKQG